MNKETVDYQLLRTQLLDYLQRVGPYLDLSMVADKLQLTRGQVYRLEGISQDELQKIADFCAGLSFNVLEQQVFSKTTRESAYAERHSNASEKAYRERYLREEVATEFGRALLNLGHIVEVPANRNPKNAPGSYEYDGLPIERRWELRLPAIASPAPATDGQLWVWRNPHNSSPGDFQLGVDWAAAGGDHAVRIVTDEKGDLRSINL